MSDERIREAVAAWNYTWPAQLESGVMFYKGLRITRSEFESENPRGGLMARVDHIDSAGYVHWKPSK